MKKKRKLVEKWKNLPIFLGLLVILLTLPLVVLEVQKRKEIRAPAAGRPIGPIAVQMAVDEFLDNPMPKMQTLVVFEGKEKVDKAHGQGYSVLTWAHAEEGEDKCRERAQTGADALVTDEIVWLTKGAGGDVGEAVRKFNNCKRAARAVNPNILVGNVEPFWADLKAFMENGANPDFVGGEVYNGDIDLIKLNQLKQQYGVKTHQWLHGVNPERDLRYIGQVDFVVFADVHGYWDCMNQPEDCGPYLEQLRAWAGATGSISCEPSMISFPAGQCGDGSAICWKTSGAPDPRVYVVSEDGTETLMHAEPGPVCKYPTWLCAGHVAVFKLYANGQSDLLDSCTVTAVGCSDWDYYYCCTPGAACDPAVACDGAPNCVMRRRTCADGTYRYERYQKCSGATACCSNGSCVTCAKPTPTPTPRPTPTPLPTPTPTPKPTATPTPKPTPTPAPGMANLTFKVKFQGISEQGPDRAVKIILKKGGNILHTEEVGVKSDENGVYSGRIMNITPNIYDIYIKGWAHLQKGFENITLTEGENNRDFSGTTLLAGDADSNNRVNIQDIRVAAKDYVPDTPPNSPADFNLDGIVNIQDIRFIVINYWQEGE